MVVHVHPGEPSILLYSMYSFPPTCLREATLESTNASAIDLVKATCCRLSAAATRKRKAPLPCQDSFAFELNNMYQLPQASYSLGSRSPNKQATMGSHSRLTAEHMPCEHAAPRTGYLQLRMCPYIPVVLFTTPSILMHSLYTASAPVLRVVNLRGCRRH